MRLLRCRSMAVLLFALQPQAPVSAQAQTSRHWITETSLTFGRSGPAYQGPGSDAVALGDLGVRWSYPSGTGWGLSATAGYDFPNEASLVGGRARVTREWGRGRLEGSVAVLVSSLDDGYLGGTVGFAFYPRPWGAVVVGLDFLPTRPSEGLGPIGNDEFGNVIYPPDPEPARQTSVSFGVRVGERIGVYTWMGSAAVALLALVFKDVDFGCC